MSDQKYFAVVYEPNTGKPYVVRTDNQVFAHARKASADKTILRLIKENYKLDTTGRTGAVLARREA